MDDDDNARDAVFAAAMDTAQCPIQFDELKAVVEEKFGCEVVLGTHSY